MNEAKKYLVIKAIAIFNPFCANLWYNKVMLLYQ